MDPDSEAAMSVINAELTRENIRELEQQKREKLIAQTHEMIGRIKTANMFGQFANVTSLVWLKQVKESKIYRDLPEIGSWERFCEITGMSRQKIDLDIQNLDTFGKDFLETLNSFRVGYKDLRKLRHSVADGQILITDDTVEIGGEQIPLSADHKEDLQAAIESLIDAKDKLLEAQESSIKAKDRVLKAKEDVIHKQETIIGKYERKAQEAGYAPGEEAYLKELWKIRTLFDGTILRVDPDHNPNVLPADATERMRASFLELCGYMRRCGQAIYDTATDHFGTALDGDDLGWVPPPLRGANSDDEEQNTCGFPSSSKN
jgi:hypothetical protein